MRRRHPPRTPLERDIVEAERRRARLRRRASPTSRSRGCASPTASGPDLRTSWSRLFALPVVPAILGFDPRLQFIHEDDIVGCLEHAVRHDLDGVFNCAADGVLALSEIAGLLGKPFAPLLPPVGTGLAAGAAKRVGIRLPPEMLRQMRFGRGLDNRRLKATGYRYRYTTRETILSACASTSASSRSCAARARALPLRARARGVPALQPERRAPERPPRRRRPSRATPRPARARRRRRRGYDDLDAREIIALLPSLDAGGLARAARARGRAPARATGPRGDRAVAALGTWALIVLHFRAPPFGTGFHRCGPGHSSSSPRSAWPLIGGAAAVYAATTPRRADEIGKGVRVGGIPLDGLSAAQAQGEARPAHHPAARAPGRRPPRPVDVDARQPARPGSRSTSTAIVDDAMARSREGNVLARTVRNLTGKSLDADVRPTVTFSDRAVVRMLDKIRGAIERRPVDATAKLSGGRHQRRPRAAPASRSGASTLHRQIKARDRRPRRPTARSSPGRASSGRRSPRATSRRGSAPRSSWTAARSGSRSTSA